jgi:hypothetical protein
MLRTTGVMDDSVFWVVGKALDSGRVLYRDIYFTQPPLFIFIPQLLWKITSNIFVHRAFLVAIWLVNGWLVYSALNRTGRQTRVALSGLFLVSAFILQSYALHTEIFVVTAFLVAVVAIQSNSPASAFVVGCAAAASLLFKPLGPLVFVPLLWSIAWPPSQRVLWCAVGALLPCALVLAYLAAQGVVPDFWQQAILDNGNVGLSTEPDPVGYFSLAVAPLLLPGFIALVAIDSRWRDVDWSMTVVLFLGLLGLEVLRGARHYGLLNLCLLVWLTVRAQQRLTLRGVTSRAVLAGFMSLALVFHIGVVYQVLSRGTVLTELSAVNDVHRTTPASLQVFANDAPRVYMLMNDLTPAYAFLFVYDTNRDLVTWDSYMDMIPASPPDYVAVADGFAAQEYGRRKSTVLVDASSVKSWLEHHGYAEIAAGPPLGLTVYQHLST